MQSEAKISAANLGEVIDAVFAQGEPLIYESSSEPEDELRQFDTPLALEAEIESHATNERRFVAYSIYYPETKGLIEERRIELIPEKNAGKRFRYLAEGWGLVHLQLTFEDEDITCRVAVNSEKRALMWRDTYPDHEDPRQWDWKLVEKHARRIIRALKKAKR